MDNALWLSRLDTEFTRRTDDRELARPAGAFAMAPAPSGAVVAMIEEVPRQGMQALLLARVNAQGEARNVPREIVRAGRIESVDAAWTGNGYVVAWSLGAASGGGSYVITTDVRGVPRTPARRVADATGVRIAHLEGADATAVIAGGPGGAATAAVLDAAGSIARVGEWPARARAIAGSPGGEFGWSIAMPAETDGTGTISVLRWPTTDGVGTTIADFRPAPSGTLVSLAGDRAGMVAAFDDASGRETIVRVSMDGSSTILASRPGSRGSLVPTDDGNVVLVGHEPPPAGVGRLAIVELLCPRVAPAATTPTTPTTPVPP